MAANLNSAPSHPQASSSLSIFMCSKHEGIEPMETEIKISNGFFFLSAETDAIANLITNNVKCLAGSRAELV